MTVADLIAAYDAAVIVFRAADTALVTDRIARADAAGTSISRATPDPDLLSASVAAADAMGAAGSALYQADQAAYMAHLYGIE